MAASIIDWVQAQADYLADSRLSYMDIAKKYGVTKKTVEQHATKGKWAITRQSVNEKSIEAIQGEIVDERAEANKRHTTMYRNMQSLAAGYLTLAYRNFEKYLQEHPNDANFDFRTNKGLLSPYNMQALLASLKLAIEGERVTLNLTTSVTRNELTGRDGDPLFEETSINELTDLVERTAQAIVAATNSKDKQQSPSNSTKPSS